MRQTKTYSFYKYDFEDKSCPDLGKPTNLDLNRQNPATKSLNDDAKTETLRTKTRCKRPHNLPLTAI